MIATKRDSELGPRPLAGGPLAYVPHTPWAPLAAIVATGAIVAASPLVGLAAARGYAWSVGLGDAGAAVSPGGIDALLMTYEAIYTAVLNLAMIALALIAASRYGRRAGEVLALDPPAGGVRDYGVSLGIALAATALWFGVLLTLIPDRVVEDFRPYPELMTRARSWLMPPIYCLLAPVAEEVLFRGFLFPALAKSRIGFAGAAVLTCAGWTALHVSRTELAYVQLFVAGLLLTWLLVRTGSLRVPMLCHALFNTGVSVMVIVLKIPA